MTREENEICNETRAQRALDAISVYTEAQAPEYDGEPMETPITDFLADLFHYCNQNDIDINAVVGMARQHFEEER